MSPKVIILMFRIIECATVKFLGRLTISSGRLSLLLRSGRVRIDVILEAIAENDPENLDL